MVHGKAPVPGDEFEVGGHWHALLLLEVKVRAVFLFAAAIQLVTALTNFEVVRMVFLLLPAVAGTTSVFKLAAISVSQQVLLVSQN